ncbi:hypothetical protein F4677DRAFT_458540 [Hypoxylon crocopeplum]|nr:hypothetical protein F4677DRAFT_458540 [Hypoxylon crocopeplum]
MERERTRRQAERILRSTARSRVQKSTTPVNTSSNRRVRQTPPKVLKAKLKKFLPLYHNRSEADASWDSNRNTWLLALPREVFREIASYLPPESIVCLTLTCKLALHTLGMSSWADKRICKRWFTDYASMLQPRSLFLELLARDVEHEHRQNKLTKYCWGQDAIVDYLPKGKDGRGYSLVFDHIDYALGSTSPTSNSPIDYLSGSFQVPTPNLIYTLSSSARRVGCNLILRHDYNLSPSSPRTPLKAIDVLSLPLRICPHQTTETGPPPKSRYTTDTNPNSPLCTHSIVSAFPTFHRAGVPQASAFRKPTLLERRMMTSADGGEDVVFKCRFCPTKWRVEYQGGAGGDGRDGLTITVFHCFFKDLSSAAKSWPRFVRREGELLGKGKRNSEFWSQGRTYADFKVE